MADLVLGLASSHSPQLSTPADGWRERGERDKGNRELIGTDGVVSNYEDLLARTDVARIAKEITPEKMEQGTSRTNKGLPGWPMTCMRLTWTCWSWSGMTSRSICRMTICRPSASTGATRSR